MEHPVQKLNDLSRSLNPLEPDGTLIAVIEMSQSSWLVAGIVPGVERQPLKKLKVDEATLLKLLHRWREEAEKTGHGIKRICVALEAGRDGFWLARWLRARDIEAHVIHASSVAVSREHRRAKTDRLDTELLKRAFLGWLRGERDHCKMVAIPTINDEDAKRPNRERESLVGEQNRIINRMKATLIRLGIRGFNPKLKKAAERLAGLRTAEGEPIPPNTLAELHRDMVRRRLVSDQIRQIEDARLVRLKQAPSDGPRYGAPVGARDRGWHRDRRHAGARGAVAKHARPTGRSALCRAHWLARRERHKTAGERACPLRQRSSSAGHDPIGVAISHVPEGQRLGAVVSISH
jgi:transposase